MFESNDEFHDMKVYIRKDVKSYSDFENELQQKHSPSVKNTHISLHFPTKLPLENHPITTLIFRSGSREDLVEKPASRHASLRILNADDPDVLFLKNPDSPDDIFHADYQNDLSLSAEEWNIDDDMFSSKKLPNNPTTLFGSSAKKVHYSITRLINNLFENPDGRMTNFQRVTIICFTGFEAYRTIISSYLTVFVPQNCGGFSCTILQNIIPKDKLELAAISVNSFMAVYFCTLFSIERVRETTIKRLLISDKTFSTDKEFLIKMLSEMEPRHQRRILRINRIYRAFAQFLLLLFFINAGISCIVIRKNYLNNTTVIVFITNTFFMINRIYKALKITSSGEYNIYSAYRSESLLYNRYRGKITETNIP
jgi:hypothetical protein